MSKRKQPRTAVGGRSVKPENRGASRGWDWRAILVVAVTVAVYANALAGPFVFDDRGTITDNPTIESIWSPRVLAAPHETPVAGRPAVNLTFAMNYAFGGRDPFGYHVVNVVLHVCCALALLGLARRLVRRVGREWLPASGAAFAVALLWAVHPLNTEAVNYVTQRTELLMALGYLLTLYAAVRAAEAAARGTGGRWEAVAIVACAVGMASKESMVTAPLMVAVIDRVFLYSSWRAALAVRRRLYGGLAATLGLLALLVRSAPRNLSAGFSAHDADVWVYLLNQTVMIARYLRLAFWPSDLVLFYGFPLPLTVADVLPQALLMAALLAATAVALWRWPRVGVLGLFFFATLAPTSSLVPIATEVGAERRMYLPLMAVIALAVIVWLRAAHAARARVTPVARARVTAAVLLVITVLLASGARARNADYRSSLRLAETTAARWPTPGSRTMFGTELAAAGRLPEAEAQLRAAGADHAPAQYYLATVLNASGRRAEAIDRFRAYIASQPASLDQVDLARALLADALVREGRLAEAAVEYRALVAAAPEDAATIGRLAEVLLRQEAYPEAIALYERAVAARPDDMPLLGGLGIALAQSGRLDEAIAVFRRAVAFDPSNEAARQNLRRAEAMRGRQ